MGLLERSEHREPLTGQRQLHLITCILSRRTFSAPEVRHNHCRARQGPVLIRHQLQGPEGRHNSSVSALQALEDDGHRKPVVDTTGRECVGLPGLKHPVHGWLRTTDGSVPGLKHPVHGWLRTTSPWRLSDRAGRTMVWRPRDAKGR